MKHTKSTRTYTDFEEFVKNEPDAVKSLIQTIGCEGDELMTWSWNWKTSKREECLMEDIDDLIEYIRESGSSEESVDYDYIHNTYTSSTGDDKFTFEVHGSSYRKDQCICDEEIDGEVTVIDSEMLKLEKKAKKAGDATRNTGLWNTLFMEKDLEELKAELLKYKFPKRI